MIIHYTEEEKAEMLDLFSQYDSRLKELSEKLTSIRDPEELDMIEKQIADPKEAAAKWIALGSPEWKTTRDEYLSLHDEYVQRRNALWDDLERRHFAKLEGDPDRILENAKSQAEELIHNSYTFYQDLTKTQMSSSGDPISGFSGHDLRVDGLKFWLDAKETAKDIKRSIHLHYEALKDDPELINKLNDIIIEAVSSSPYVSDKDGKLGRQYLFKKPGHKKKNLPVYDASQEEELILFPTTEVNSILYSLLSENGDFKDTALAINKVAKRNVAKIGTGQETGIRFFEVDTPKTTTRIELLKQPQRNQGETATKVLVFIENELLRHLYYKGRLTSDLHSFSIQKMAEKMNYSSEKNARRAFNDAADILTSIRASAHVKSGKRTVKTADVLASLFNTMRIVDGQCYVRINKDINWQPILGSYFEMPDSWFSLPDNARDLEFWIFQRARMNKTSIDTEKHSLTLNFPLRSIAARLSLPVGKTKNPQRDIKTAIETAVKQVRDSLDPQDFQIEIKTDLTAGIAEYLAGYISVVFKGKYIEKLENIKLIQESIIEENTRLKNEREHEERMMILAAQIEASEEDY